jgi:predicted  nucleic acid-binding Zn-ribbon protein
MDEMMKMQGEASKMWARGEQGLGRLSGDFVDMKDELAALRAEVSNTAHMDQALGGLRSFIEQQKLRIDPLEGVVPYMFEREQLQALRNAFLIWPRVQWRLFKACMRVRRVQIHMLRRFAMRDSFRHFHRWHEQAQLATQAALRRAMKQVPNLEEGVYALKQETEAIAVRVGALEHGVQGQHGEIGTLRMGAKTARDKLEKLESVVAGEREAAAARAKAAGEKMAAVEAALAELRAVMEQAAADAAEALRLAADAGGKDMLHKAAAELQALAQRVAVAERRAAELRSEVRENDEAMKAGLQAASHATELCKAEGARALERAENELHAEQLHTSERLEQVAEELRMQAQALREDFEAMSLEQNPYNRMTAGELAVAFDAKTRLIAGSHYAFEVATAALSSLPDSREAHLAAARLREELAVAVHSPVQCIAEMVMLRAEMTELSPAFSSRPSAAALAKAAAAQQPPPGGNGVNTGQAGRVNRQSPAEGAAVPPLLQQVRVAVRQRVKEMDERLEATRAGSRESFATKVMNLVDGAIRKYAGATNELVMERSAFSRIGLSTAAGQGNAQSSGHAHATAGGGSGGGEDKGTCAACDRPFGDPEDNGAGATCRGRQGGRQGARVGRAGPWCVGQGHRRRRRLSIPTVGVPRGRATAAARSAGHAGSRRRRRRRRRVRARGGRRAGGPRGRAAELPAEVP